MRKSYFVPAALIVGFLIGRPANAMSGAGTECADKQNVREAAICLSNALIDAKKALDEKYAAVKNLELMSGEGLQKKLAHSQSAWQAYVTQTCDDLIEQSTKDEPIGISDVLSCKLELTKERTSDLDRMFYVPLHN
jgi:uncharacterized protein YecT (DUF1311 family)